MSGSQEVNCYRGFDLRGCYVNILSFFRCVFGLCCTRFEVRCVEVPPHRKPPYAKEDKGITPLLSHRWYSFPISCECVFDIQVQVERSLGLSEACELSVSVLRKIHLERLKNSKYKKKKKDWSQLALLCLLKKKKQKKRGNVNWVFTYFSPPSVCYRSFCFYIITIAIISPQLPLDLPLLLLAHICIYINIYKFPNLSIMISSH